MYSLWETRLRCFIIIFFLKETKILLTKNLESKRLFITCCGVDNNIFQILNLEREENGARQWPAIRRSEFAITWKKRRKSKWWTRFDTLSKRLIFFDNVRNIFDTFLQLTYELLKTKNDG